MQHLWFSQGEKHMLGTKRLTIILAAAALAAAAQGAWAEEKAATDAGDSAGTELGDIIVTGTRRTDRTVIESSAPIDVLTGADLAAQSTGNMLDTLSNMVPSFIVGQNSISDASSFVRSPSLRGLPGDEMLVLLNGKRMNRSALVQVYQGGETELAFGSQGPDLASIPAIAVKSLEILRDGASAQYGSDAIAGVLNYGFRENSSGIEVTGRYGEYFPGNGFPRDGNDGQLAANVGLPLGGQGFFNVSAEWDKNQQTTRGVTRPSALAFAEDYPALAPELPHYPGPVQQWGTPPSDGVKVVINSAIKLDNNDQVYFFANYADIETNESFNYRLPKTVTDPNSGVTFGNHPAFNNIYLDPCTSAYSGCPTGGFINDANTFNFSSYYPAGFTPRFYGETQQFYGAVGYKGTSSSGISYDISGSTAQNSLAVSLQDTINPSLGPLSPKSFYDGKFVQKETDFNVDLSYPWTVPVFASPVSVAGGLEWRDETYEQLLGDAASYAAGPYASQPLYNCVAAVCTPDLGPTGAQVSASQSTASNGYGGISAPVDAGQVSYAAYVDLEADVLKQLTLGIAGRYEDYASYGSSTLGKLQARFKATDWLALRATASTGFHAPTPGQSNVETLSTTFLPGTATQVQIGTYPVTSAIAKYYGATSLKPEESTNLSGGFVLTPAPGLLLTLDGYSIAVRHRIGISQQFNVSEADIEKLAALATEDGLTGLKNYRTFNEQLTLELERGRRYHQPVSLILADVDHFKQYNDMFGHVEGDAVLQRVAALLADSVRDVDLVARYGGEEFVLLLPNTEAKGASLVAERCRLTIEKAKWTLRPIAMSFGVATFKPDVEGTAGLVAIADRALYVSKQSGRNRVSHADQVVGRAFLGGSFAQAPNPAAKRRTSKAA